MSLGTSKFTSISAVINYNRIRMGNLFNIALIITVFYNDFVLAKYTFNKEDMQDDVYSIYTPSVNKVQESSSDSDHEKVGSCNCKNGYCEEDSKGKMVCKCPPEWGSFTPAYCRKCNCGEGANCTFPDLLVTSKKCICKEGFKDVGGKCKECCKNGYCEADKGKEVCKCPPEWGHYSETECKKCDCGEGINCTFRPTLLSHNKQCICKEGFKDVRGTCKECCENGQCEKDDEGKQICKCPPGWGLYSETECKKCECGEGINCTFRPTIFSDNKYCICKEGYKDVSGTCKECCKNGNCEEDDEGKKVCKCPPEWGLYSETECRKCECGEDINCTFRPTLFKDNKHCICKEGYKDVSGTCKECCKNGYCESDDEGKKVCKCPPEWGLYSETECKKCDCGEGANCTFPPTIFSYNKHCICKEGFKDVNGTCKEDILSTTTEERETTDAVTTEKDDILPITTEKSRGTGDAATTETEGIGSITTEVSRGTTDTVTTEKDSCTENPCKNGGICQIEGKRKTCYCRIPYFGEFCENDPCSRNPCKNRGNCHIRNRTFYCECDEPYHGPRCEKDPCTANPCQNGGRCYVDKNTFVCVCKQPYVGLVCESNYYTYSNIIVLVVLLAVIVTLSCTIVCAICQRKSWKD